MIVSHIKRNLITGLLIIFPTYLTISIILNLFHYVDNILQPLLKEFSGYTITGLGFFILVSVVYFTGMITSNLIGRQIVHLWESAIKKIPLVNRLFTIIREISHSVLGNEKMLFSQVVMFEYPYKGLYSVGFVTKEAEDNPLGKYVDCPVVNIFLPTTPNPTSGLIIVVPKDKIIVLDMSIEEAMKFIMSAGSLGNHNSILTETSKSESKEVL